MIPSVLSTFFRIIPPMKSRAGLGLLFFVLFAATSPFARAQVSEPAFLVLAPDRGFLGNEEARDVFNAFHERVPDSQIAFATLEKTEENLEGPISALRANDPERKIVVLPLFMSEHEGLYQEAADVLNRQSTVTLAEPFGAGYLAEELLFDQIRSSLGDAHGGHGSHGPYLVVLADGAGGEESAAGIREDLEPLVDRAVQQFGLAGGEVAVLHGRSSEAGRDAFNETIGEIRAAAGRHEQVLLVPFNFGLRLTTMMSHWNWAKMGLPGAENVTFGEPEITSHPNVGRWLVRSSSAHSPLTEDEIGVIFVPHGSEYNWNEMMRKGLEPLRDEYVTEDAFSMMDPYVVERAVRKLEERGMKAAVVLRIFSLESSFKEQAEYTLGLRREPPTGGHMGTPDRIESHLLFNTLGGVEAHPRFAQALLERAQEISTDPTNETVILLAHGTGDDTDNDRWMQNLASIGEYIRENSPNAYRDIKWHTWREDWPDKRAKTIPEIRAMIEEANENGGTALVIPVRTNQQGPARELVPDLEFRYGYGFSPHPQFAEWAREQIEAGMQVLIDASANGDHLSSKARP